MIQNKLTDWLHWQRIFSRQSRRFDPADSASSGMFEIRAAIWRKLRARKASETNLQISVRLGPKNPGRG